MTNNNTSPTANVSPLDALKAHFYASSKSVQRAFVNMIIKSKAEELEAARQKAMVRESLNQAFIELNNGEARTIDNLFNEM